MTAAGAGVPDRVLVGAGALLDACIRLLEKVGVPAEDARTTADVFCQSERMGEEGHGIRLFVTVVGRLRAGGDQPVARIERVMDRGAVALWDAHRSLGQVTAARAMDRAVAKARDHGIGMVAVRNGNSLTSAKYYALSAARAGMIGLVYTNASRKVMPPPGGITPVMGNNPVAVAAPAMRHSAFVLDMACTAAAIERILAARDRGEPIPEGWAIGPDGSPTTDAALAARTMSLLPFGGHKAFGLASVHEILTSVLSGGPLMAGESTGFFPVDGPMNTSFSLMAIDISAFQPVEEFKARMDAMIDAVKASRPAVPGATILHAGERSLAEERKRIDSGVPLAAVSFQALRSLADELDVAPLKALATGPSPGSVV